MSIFTSCGNLISKKHVFSTSKSKENENFILLPVYAICLVVTAEESKRSTLMTEKFAGVKG
jgi:hypothetical protein